MTSFLETLGRDASYGLRMLARDSRFTTAAVDLRYAARTLRKELTFVLTAVATLAMEIGTNTAMFSVLNAVVLRPLPYRAPEQLVMLWTEDPTQNLREGRSALSDVEQWRA